MGTKAQPGAYDFHAKARADEEMFTLLARDPLAPGLVFIWSALKSHAFATAEVMLRDLIKVARAQPKERYSKTYEALTCGDRMIDWYHKPFGAPTPDRGPRRAIAGSTVPSAASPSPTPNSESTVIPNAAGAAG